MNIEHRDPYLGAKGYYDGSDASLLAQVDPEALSPKEKVAIKEVYDDIFGDERMSPTKKPRSKRKQ